MSKIFIDTREDKKIIRELVKHNLDIEIKQLIVADFIIQTKDVNDKIIQIGIERKTTNDFLNSIIDRRIITQLMRLKENFEAPILVIEGEENIYQIRNFHPNAIRGMFASIAIDFQIPILYTKNHRDTASLIGIISKHLDKQKKPMSLLSKRKPLTKKEQKEYLVESLPGIGPTLAKSILKELKTIKNLANSEEAKLKEIEKIGPKKAKEIYDLFNEEY